ncbi:MAG: sigma-70 family RNA polymerase sigma factor [Planctomycetes bacterium]|nr:sigma-70 family RNA polymerase sigma factor [Planctomycetota bacterium]
MSQLPNKESGSPEPTDTELVRRCLGGDESAWRQIVKRFGPLVISIPARAGLNPDSRDDVFQATFMALFRHLGSLRDAQSLAKWIITTATRETWRERKRQRSAIHRPEHEPIDIPPDDVAAMERAHIVDLGLRKLGGRCEELLRRLFGPGEGADYRKIAQDLSIPIGSIGPTRQRCLAKLAELISESI